MNLNAIATKLDAAAVNATAVEQISKSQHINLDQAYDIQRMAIDHRLNRGEAFVGIKMGFTSEAKMKQMGVNDMIWGRLTGDMIVLDKAVLKFDRFIHPRAEPEICFRLSEDVDREVPMEEIMSITDGMAAAIEVIDSRYMNFKFSLEDVVADNCSSAALTVGPWQSPTQKINDLGMRLLFDDEVMASGSSADILGDPWRSLQAATRLAAQYNQPLKKGNIVMAGAATAAAFLKPGTIVTAEVERMGKAQFEVK